LTAEQREEAVVTVQCKAHEIIQTIADDRCVELFRTYGLSLNGVTPSEAPPYPLLHCGVVGFSGHGIRGSVAIAGSRSVLGASNPLSDQASRDWAGELANQLMGHVKSGLLAHGVEVYLSTPTVLRGEHLALQTHTDLPPHLFVPAPVTGLLGVWVDVEVDPDFRIRSEPDPALAGFEGGETLLF
jgi:hypothetical protein